MEFFMVFKEKKCDLSFVALWAVGMITNDEYMMQ